MAVDKLVDSAKLDTEMVSVANSIRAKSGSTGGLLWPDGFITAINNLGGSGITSITHTRKQSGASVGTTLDVSGLNLKSSNVAGFVLVDHYGSTTARFVNFMIGINPYSSNLTIMHQGSSPGTTDTGKATITNSTIDTGSQNYRFGVSSYYDIYVLNK